MDVGAVCNRRVPMVTAATSVSAAADSMRLLDEPILVVTDDQGGRRAAVGIVTEREIARRVVTAGMDPSRLALADVMQSNPGFVNESDDVYETACWMHRNRLREAVVHDASGSLVGIVTIAHLIDLLADEFVEFAEVAADSAGPLGRAALH